MFRPERALVNRDGPRVVLHGFVPHLPLFVQIAQAVQVRGDVLVLRAQKRDVDRERSLVKRLSVFQPVHVLEKRREVVQPNRHDGVRDAPRAFVDRERAD